VDQEVVVGMGILQRIPWKTAADSTSRPYIRLTAMRWGNESLNGRNLLKMRNNAFFTYFGGIHGPSRHQM
jgi:hypothetical protein